MRSLTKASASRHSQVYQWLENQSRNKMNKTFKRHQLPVSNPMNNRLKHKRIRKALENLGTEMLILKRILEVHRKMNEQPSKEIGVPKL